MSKFYFDVADDKGEALDEIGSTFRDLEAARLEAMRSLGDMAKDIVSRGGQKAFLAITIRDDRMAYLKLNLQIDTIKIDGG